MTKKRRALRVKELMRSSYIERRDYEINRNNIAAVEKSALKGRRINHLIKKYWAIAMPDIGWLYGEAPRFNAARHYLIAIPMYDWGEIAPCAILRLEDLSIEEKVRMWREIAATRSACNR